MSESEYIGSEITDFDKELELNARISKWARYLEGLNGTDQPVSLDRLMREVPHRPRNTPEARDVVQGISREEASEDLAEMLQKGFIDLYAFEDSKMPYYALSNEGRSWAEDTLDFSDSYRQSIGYGMR